jgi:phosphoribosyl 1,2-cyclic phosphodiesterase
VGEIQGNLRLRFWGVRGSIPSPGPDTAIYGGNTACVEVAAGKRTLVIDAGSGIRALGDVLARNPMDRVDVLFSHCHFDHIEGLPFFAPLYMSARPVNFWSGHIQARNATREMIASLIRAPYFPIDPSSFRAALFYHDFKSGDTLEPGEGIVVRTIPLHHPGGATGFRISFNGRSLCYISDVEHRSYLEKPLVQFVSGTDFMIYDAMYKDEEYPRYEGFGHSTWQEAIKLADAAGVGMLALYHHFPGRSDPELAAVEALAKARRPKTLVAREGMEFSL